MRSTWIHALALVALAAPLEAQRPLPDRGTRQDRPALEKRFRERLGAVMRERLGLTEEQGRQLEDLNGKYEGRRRALFQEEREVRLGLRRNLMGEVAPSNDEVAALLDRALTLERQRVDLMGEEQVALAKFLSPIQRAKYFGMQEQLRRQMSEMRGRREGGFGLPPDSTRAPMRRRRPGIPGA